MTSYPCADFVVENTASFQFQTEDAARSDCMHEEELLISFYIKVEIGKGTIKTNLGHT